VARAAILACRWGIKERKGRRQAGPALAQATVCRRRSTKWLAAVAESCLGRETGDTGDGAKLSLIAGGLVELPDSFYSFSNN